jgi:excisionase family DNA binding protein
MEKDQTVLNTKAAAKMLGVHIETIRRLARRGELPSFKIGKDWRFRREALLQWMENVFQQRDSPSLLVIDDELSLRKLIRIHLESEGYRVVTAASGREGLDMVRSIPIDLVLLDLKMPGMNGPEIVAELQKSHPDLPIVVVTGYPDSQLMMEINAQCPVMLVAKPVDKKVLLSAVRITLEGTLAKKLDYFGTGSD